MSMARLSTTTFATICRSLFLTPIVTALNVIIFVTEAFSDKKLQHGINIDALSFTHSHIPSVDVNYPGPHIHRLPVELLQHIFLLVMNDVPDCPSIFLYGATTISANFANPPLVFTRVCCLWRAIALSTTRLWSRIHVMLPGLRHEFRPLLPHLLQCWLACSGCQPLTLRICKPTYSRLNLQQCYLDADAQLLRILLSARDRWESVTFKYPIHDAWRYQRNDEISAPQLRTLGCHWSDITTFDAPNLSHLHIIGLDIFFLEFKRGKDTHHLYFKNTHSRASSPWIFPTPACNNVRNLRLQIGSAHIIHFTAVIFPRLETIVVDEISSKSSARDDSPVTHSSLESMTLPLILDHDRQFLPIFNSRHYFMIFIEIFNGFHLPMLQKLTVVGVPNKPEVDCIMAALAVAHCHVQVIDFQVPPTEVDVSGTAVEPLLSVAKEVTVCGVLYSRSPCNSYKPCL
ncbi:hypothetical protein DEU56DRAFT_802031, partial [Suillus clintonianus]|uniref:uncharacterized protein n=1 Tax=Suillus clintonianus TaxID=1904413 RepID=UPI001B8698F7